jgi:hypothetical protein
MNVDEEQLAAQKFRITSIPTCCVQERAGGASVRRRTGREFSGIGHQRLNVSVCGW